MRFTNITNVVHHSVRYTFNVKIILFFISGARPRIPRRGSPSGRLNNVGTHPVDRAPWGSIGHPNIMSSIIMYPLLLLRTSSITVVLQI